MMANVMVMFGNASDFVPTKDLDLLQVDSNCIGKKVARRARAPERNEGARARARRTTF